MKKLIEYGVVTSNRSSNMKQKLDALELVENIDYRLLDVQQPVPQGRSADSTFGEGGYSTKKVYRREAPSPKATTHSRSIQKLSHKIWIFVNIKNRKSTLLYIVIIICF